MQVPLTSIGFTNSVSSLIFSFLQMLIDVVTTKDETPIKKICETDEGPIKEQDVLLTTFPAVLMSTHWLCLPT